MIKWWVISIDDFTYSELPKVFVKYGVGNMEYKNRLQRNTDFAYMFQRQGNPAGTPGYRNGTDSFYGLKGRQSVVRDA